MLPEFIVRAVEAAYDQGAAVFERYALAVLLENWIVEGGDVNERTEDGTPLLMSILYAARGPPPIDAIKVVLTAGADPDALFADMESSETPLTLALLEAGAEHDGWREVVCELIAHGADLDLRDCDGDTPLMTVLQMRYSARKLDFLHLLLRHGADVSKEQEMLIDLLDDDNHAETRALLTTVISAGSWKKYLHEPRARLDTLRVLCSRGRATPPPGPLARLFPCDAPCAGSVRARRVVPLGVFRTILCFWRSDRDDLPPVGG